jgi:hypothetical protein
VPLKGISWEANREPAGDPQGPIEAILRASESLSAPPPLCYAK